MQRRQYCRTVQQDARLFLKELNSDAHSSCPRPRRGGGNFLNFVNDEDILFTDHTHYRHLRVRDVGLGSHPVCFYALNMEHAMAEANLEIDRPLSVHLCRRPCAARQTACWGMPPTTP
jgi:hypothetical protein